MVVKQGNKYVVKSERGKTLSRPYATKQQAQKRLAQIEYFKSKKWGINMKDLLVALSYQEDKSCGEIFKVINIDKQEFKRLCNEKNKNKESELKALELRQKAFEELKHKVDTREFILAKSIYDNFVDRGLIEDSQEFQQMFYDHIFKSKKYDEKLVPQEFLTILEYLRRL